MYVHSLYMVCNRMMTRGGRDSLKRCEHGSSEVAIRQSARSGSYGRVAVPTSMPLELQASGWSANGDDAPSGQLEARAE